VRIGDNGLLRCAQVLDSKAKRGPKLRACYTGRCLQLPGGRTTRCPELVDSRTNLYPELSGGHAGRRRKLLRMNVEQKEKEAKYENMFQHGHKFFCKISIYRKQRKPRKISASRK